MYKGPYPEWGMTWGLTGLTIVLVKLSLGLEGLLRYFRDAVSLYLVLFYKVTRCVNKKQVAPKTGPQTSQEGLSEELHPISLWNIRSICFRFVHCIYAQSIGLHVCLWVWTASRVKIPERKAFAPHSWKVLYPARTIFNRAYLW